jgi:cytochrome o ubiquinol oxidase subunit 2
VSGLPRDRDTPQAGRRWSEPIASRLQHNAGELPVQANGTRITLRGIALALVGLPLASCGEGVLAPRGPIGGAEFIILFDATAIMLAVVIPVILLTVAFAWWFRAGNTRALYLPTWEYSGRIEMIVWSIPTLVIVFLGGIAWISSHDLDPPLAIESATPPLHVEVVSLDWKWLFIYPDQGIASVNRLVVPVGVPLRFRLTSASVMNSFFVPELGSQIYTMPGMTTQLNLRADQTGVYKGFSAQFSGDGFSDMRFELAAVPVDQFASWVEGAKAQGRKLDPATYAILAQPSKAVVAATYALVAEGLFEAVSGDRVSADQPAHKEH